MQPDLILLQKLQSELEAVMLEVLGDFIREHPEADSSRFAVVVFLTIAGRIGLSHLDAEDTARLMEETAAAIRKHADRAFGGPEPGPN